jgi:hypothetical protein
MKKRDSDKKKGVGRKKLRTNGVWIRSGSDFSKFRFGSTIINN